MKNFLEALYKTICSVAIDVIMAVVVIMFFVLVWKVNIILAIITYVFFAMLVYMEYDKIKDDN